MVRGLISPKFLIPVIKPLPKYHFDHSNPFSSLNPHHPFDELSQRVLSPYNQVAFGHCISIKTGGLSDIMTCTSLLTAYARALDSDSSLALFDEANSHDLISWNATINALVLNSRFGASFALFREMVKVFGEFDSTTLVIVLSAITRTNNLKHGAVVHGAVIKRRFERDACLCNALIDMYVKCGGDMSSAESLFEEMEVKDVVSWNSMINGYVYNGFLEKSAFFFREMNRCNVRADQVSLSCMISSCCYLEEGSDIGESVHGLVIKLGYEGMHHMSISNSMIFLYCRYGNVEAAEEVFRLLANKNLVSWNSMISGLVENERFSEGLDLFLSMRSMFATEPDSVTLITIAQVCSRCNLLQQGKSIHGFSIRRELVHLDSSISNSLLDMYVNCEDLTSAEFLFSSMHNRDLISWNTMIGGYSCDDSLKEKARSLFFELLHRGLECSLVTLLAILPSCNCPEDIGFGKAVHCWMLKCGILNIVAAINALILMYINCRDLRASSLLLRSILLDSDTVSWNTIIVGCMKNGCYEDALKAFKFMRNKLYQHPDPITLGSALSACGNLHLLLDGKYIHGLSLKSSMGSDVRVRNALITMYFRCGEIGCAESVFQTHDNRNLCSWNCMISGYAQNNKSTRALWCFHQMETFCPNEFSLLGVLCACTQLGNLPHGTEIHGYVFRSKLQTNPFILSALVDLYSKCGRLDIAVRVFENSVEKSVPSWNSMISAYGFHGNGKEAIKLFSEMSKLGTMPTKSTFVALLSACSHSRMVDEGWKHYKLMSVEFGIDPTVEHQVCMVDMLGRAGMLTEAYEFVKKMQVEPKSGVWGSLLSGCNDCADLKLGKSIADHLFHIEPENTGYYVTLSNLYACYGLWHEAEEVRSMIQDRGLMKPPGFSFIDVLN